MQRRSLHAIKSKSDDVGSGFTLWVEIALYSKLVASMKPQSKYLLSGAFLLAVSRPSDHMPKLRTIANERLTSGQCDKHLERLLNNSL